ncbi:hypothetical protein DL765_006147 [Monosporascus sp. GIB2]|nr:hypothetical protein DL765_006147 [Monosporascus sp. GIB2]
METREEKLATWADPSIDRLQSLRVLKGSLSLNPNDLDKRALILEDKIQFGQIEDHLLNINGDNISDDDGITSLWCFKVISLPRLRPGRLALSIPKQLFQQIQDSWNLHPRTIEVFLSNNGVFTTFHSSSSGRTSLLLKVAVSRSTGYDCVSVTCDPSRRTTYVLYHHLKDEASVFATLLSTPERCIDPYFFVAALYRCHHQHIETHRNTIDDAVRDIERQTGFGNPGRLMGSECRASLDEYPVIVDEKSTIQQLSYCQTDLAAIGHSARCCLECGKWLVQAIDDALLSEEPSHYGREPHDGSGLHQRGHQYSESLRAVRLMVRQDVEYIRRRTVMLLSQVQAIGARAQSQTNFLLNTITQSDAAYTAAIALDGKRDSSAMKTIAILGIVFLPGTYVATLFSIDMFDWGGVDSRGTSGLTVSSSMWIYWAITVPLTVVTFLVWVLWSRRENNKGRGRLAIHHTRAPIESESAAMTKMV